MSAPTEVKPLTIKRSLGGSGTYQGLQQMSTAQMQYTFGQRAKNRIMNGNNGVGTYLLLSSSVHLLQMDMVHGTQGVLQ